MKYSIIISLFLIGRAWAYRLRGFETYMEETLRNLQAKSKILIEKSGKASSGGRGSAQVSVEGEGGQRASGSGSGTASASAFSESEGYGHTVYSGTKGKENSKTQTKKKKRNNTRKKKAEKRRADVPENLDANEQVEAEKENTERNEHIEQFRPSGIDIKNKQGDGYPIW